MTKLIDFVDNKQMLQHSKLTALALAGTPQVLAVDASFSGP